MSSSGKKQVKYKISWIYGFLLISIAGLYDIWEWFIDTLGTALIAVFGAGLLLWILNWITWCLIVFLLWLLFALRGVFLTVTPKKQLVASVTMIVEAIPGLDASLITAFGWTLGTFILIWISRAEDRGEQAPTPKDMAKKAKGAKKLLKAVGGKK